MSTIHWLGAGLSSAPGIEYLVKDGQPLLLWNRTLEKANAIMGPLGKTSHVREMDFTALEQALSPGDIVISMLPADLHIRVARMAITREAHFVCSSYISEDMHSLNDEASRSGLCLVNEVGLDPGIDHLMAHDLVHRFMEWGGYRKGMRLQFRSYCGGFPAVANDFRYKFSWSPVGVLRALKTPARALRAGETIDVERPWNAVTTYDIETPGSTESFEAYPNRNSLPFIQQYALDENWQLDEFVRGTLRLSGWTEAWSPIFETLSSPVDEHTESRLQDLGKELWARYAYEPGEPDRVVLCVELKCVTMSGDTTWHQSYLIDATGDDRGSAMARLVSLPVAIAVKGILDGQIPHGVSTGPHDNPGIRQWLETLTLLGEEITLRDHLAG